MEENEEEMNSLKEELMRKLEQEMFEYKESLIKARNKSKKFTYNWNVVDGDRSVEEISNEIIYKCLG